MIDRLKAPTEVGREKRREKGKEKGRGQREEGEEEGTVVLDEPSPRPVGQSSSAMVGQSSAMVGHSSSAMAGHSPSRAGVVGEPRPPLTHRSQGSNGSSGNSTLSSHSRVMQQLTRAIQYAHGQRYVLLIIIAFRKAQKSIQYQHTYIKSTYTETHARRLRTARESYVCGLSVSVCGMMQA